MIEGFPSFPLPQKSKISSKSANKWRNWRFWGKRGGEIINFYLNYYWWTYENVMFQISSKSGIKWRILLLQRFVLPFLLKKYYYLGLVHPWTLSAAPQQASYTVQQPVLSESCWYVSVRSSVIDYPGLYIFVNYCALMHMLLQFFLLLGLFLVNDLQTSPPPPQKQRMVRIF